MDAADLAAFTASLREAADRHADDFDKALEEVGWREALVEDSSAARAVFAVQGELNLSSSALDDVLLHAIGRVPDADAAVVLALHPVGTRRLATARTVLVVANDVEPISPSRMSVRAVDGIDPAGGWVTLAGTFSVLMVGGKPPPLHETALAAGRLAIATELAAASRTMLELARQHAVTRVQFGKPIASFQAVRHRLADALVATAAADAAVDAGWEDPTSYTATMAKAIAGRSARTVARHAQQVLAGMGFTSEHPFHRYFRRLLALDQLLGSATALSTSMGEQALHDRTIPGMLAL